MEYLGRSNSSSTLSHFSVEQATVFPWPIKTVVANLANSTFLKPWSNSCSKKIAWALQVLLVCKLIKSSYVPSRSKSVMILFILSLKISAFPLIYKITRK